jgi:hypothetical protein
MSANFRRLKLFSSLESGNQPPSQRSPCCDAPLSDDDVEALNSCIQVNLNDDELATLYFISGYIAHKEDILVQDGIPTNELPSSQFTELVSRGKLCHPPDWLFVFVQCAYSVIRKTNATCANKSQRLLLRLFNDLHFNLLHDCYNADHLCRRLVNTLIVGSLRRAKSGIVRRAPSLSLCDRKRRKL